MIDDKTSREDLEAAIIGEDELYRAIDEHKFLTEAYTTEELREFVRAWIVAGDETASA